MLNRLSPFPDAARRRGILAWSLALAIHLAALSAPGPGATPPLAADAAPMRAHFLTTDAPGTRAGRPASPVTQRRTPLPRPSRAPATAIPAKTAPDAEPAQPGSRADTPLATPEAPPAGLPGRAGPSAAPAAPLPGSEVPLAQRCPQRILPDFPLRALRAGILEGRVELRLHLNAEGMVSTTEVLRADPPGYFEAAAHEAAQHWRCLPSAEAGASVRVPFVFHAQ